MYSRFVWYTLPLEYNYYIRKSTFLLAVKSYKIYVFSYDHWAGIKKKWFKEMYLTVRMFLYVMNTHNTCTFHVIGNFKAKQTCALYNISLPSWQNADILTIPGFYVVDILKSSLIIRNVAHVTAVCIFFLYWFHYKLNFNIKSENAIHLHVQ